MRSPVDKKAVSALYNYVWHLADTDFIYSALVAAQLSDQLFATQQVIPGFKSK